MLKTTRAAVPGHNDASGSAHRSRAEVMSGIPALGGSDDRIGTVTALLQRLELELVGESKHLSGGQIPALQDSTNRKGQGLLELTRALRGLDARETLQYRALLSRVQKAAEDNRDRLRLHMEAARSVTSMIAQSMRDAELDGTYGAHTRSADSEL